MAGFLLVAYSLVYGLETYQPLLTRVDGKDYTYVQFIYIYLGQKHPFPKNENILSLYFSQIGRASFSRMPTDFMLVNIRKLQF